MADSQHILMTADTVGGVFSYAIELARALEPHGVKIELATMGAPLSTAQWRTVAALSNVTVHESRYRLEWMEDPWAEVFCAGEWLGDLERKFRPDVVHLNQYAFGALSWSAPTVLVAHSCVLSWWRAVHGADAPEDKWGRYREAVARGLAGVDEVVAPSRTMLSTLSCHYGRPGSARVIYNGIQRPQEQISTEKRPLVVAAGRLWDAAKNLDALLAAAPSLDWPLAVAGPTTSPDGQGHAPQSKALLGPLAREQIIQLLERASIYALPALYEPFGLSVLEAAQAGCALVLGDIPSMRELWEGAAEFVDPRDGEQLIRSINSLTRDRDRRSELARTAMARTVRYSADTMARGYLSLYQALHSRKARTCA